MNLKVICFAKKRLIYISKKAFVSWNNLVYGHPYKIFQSPKYNETTTTEYYRMVHAHDPDQGLLQRLGAWLLILGSCFVQKRALYLVTPPKQMPFQIMKMFFSKLRTVHWVRQSHPTNSQNRICRWFYAIYEPHDLWSLARDANGNMVTGRICRLNLKQQVFAIVVVIWAGVIRLSWLLMRYCPQ